jgi:hypothetical protein
MSKNQLHDFAKTKEKGLVKGKERKESIGAFMKRRNKKR